MSLRPLALIGLVGAFILPQAAAATVTISDCASDPHCVAVGKKTVIAVPGDTVVFGGAIVPLAGTTTVQVSAQAIVVDGASGGQISVTGKGQSIVLDAASVLVTGSLHSADTNGKIILRGADTVQLQGSLDIDSGGEARVLCTGIGCTLNVVNVRFHCNHLVLDAQGDIIWDGNTIDTFGPRDLIEIDAENGSIRKSGAITIALARGRLAAEVDLDKVDAVSEAVEFCQACQGTPTPPTPGGRTPTPTTTASVPLMTASLPLGTPVPTATSTTGGTPTSTASVPTASVPLMTASLPLGTPASTVTASVPGSTPTATDPTPTRTPTPTGTPTPNDTHTPVGTPTPCVDCDTMTGGVESTFFMHAAGDIDVSGQHYRIAEGITIAAGGNVNLTNSELNNDFGKCGEIIVTAGAQINIQGATLVDDDCRGKPDVSELNGREEVPHTGFNGVVGSPAVDN
jgi:hypothetical protein